MTNREFFNAVIAAESLPAEMHEFAESALAKLDATNEKRRNAQSKKALENVPFVDYIVVNILNSQPQTASDVTPLLNAGMGTEFKVQKVSALLRIAVKEERARSMDVKIPGKGTQKGYVLAE